MTNIEVEKRYKYTEDKKFTDFLANQATFLKEKQNHDI